MHRHKKIIFINPFMCGYRLGQTGIAYLRGYLKYSNIKSDLLNINDLFYENPEDQEILNRYYSHIYSMVGRGNRNKSSLFENLARMFTRILWTGTEEVMRMLSETKYLDQLFIKYYSRLSGYDIAGFSVTTHPQLFFSLMSALYIKDKINKDIEIVFGGTRVSVNISSLIGLLKGKPAVNYFVAGEGEAAMYDLTTDSASSRTTNLVYLDNSGEYIYSSEKRSFKVGDYRPPLYEPNDIPVIRGSNSVCFWRKCSFCGNYSKNSKDKKYVARKPDEIIGDIRIIQEAIKSEKRLYYFSDSAMPVELLDSLSRRIIEEKNMPDKFRVNMRFDPRINRDLLIRAKDAGFGKGEGLGGGQGLIVFGLETATLRLQKLMERGVGNNIAERVIRLCCETGVNIKVNIIGGFPTQTEKEFRADLEFLGNIVREVNCKKFTINLNPFLLLKDSKIYSNADKYKIKIIDDRPFFPCLFKQLEPGAITPVSAVRIFDEFVNSLPTNHRRVFVKWGNQFSYLIETLYLQ